MGVGAGVVHLWHLTGHFVRPRQSHWVGSRGRGSCGGRGVRARRQRRVVRVAAPSLLLLLRVQCGGGRGAELRGAGEELGRTSERELGAVRQAHRATQRGTAGVLAHPSCPTCCSRGCQCCWVRCSTPLGAVGCPAAAVDATTGGGRAEPRAGATCDASVASVTRGISRDREGRPRAASRQAAGRAVAGAPQRALADVERSIGQSSDVSSSGTAQKRCPLSSSDTLPVIRHLGGTQPGGPRTAFRARCDEQAAVETLGRAAVHGGHDGVATQVCAGRHLPRRKAPSRGFNKRRTVLTGEALS